MTIQQTLIDINESSTIPGLIYLPDYITTEEQDFLIRQIDQQPWLSDLKRRVQHYGYKYDYKARTIDQKFFLGPLPEWLHHFAPGSLVILADEARYQWQHAIPARKSDIINGIRVERERRISLTFRNVILNPS